MKQRLRMTLSILLALVVLVGFAAVLFINRPSFGRQPRGERLERVRRSPNYRNGEFRNQHATPLLASGKSRVGTMLGFLFDSKPADVRPPAPIESVRTDLRALPAERDAIVWFGHSSYLLQVGGKRVLVDPVFCAAAPIGFFNKPFDGAAIYSPDDIPEIDYLLITHDHWDHLDYETVTRLRERIGRVICPLGVGEHFERWGFRPEQLIELDWMQTASEPDSLRIHCLPARHFSGRGLKANQTLWASFLLKFAGQKVFFSGDGGYDTHFAQIGAQFPDIDLAVLENGQYNASWRYIHTMPEELPLAVRDLRARKTITGHHSKYALARHRWDEPLATARQMQADSLAVLTPRIGEVVEL